MDDAFFVFSAFFKLRLRFNRDFQPLPDFGCGLVRLFQFTQVTGSDFVVDRLEVLLHVRQLAFKRIDRGRQARGPLIGGD